MTRSVFVTGSLLATSLVAAFFVATREPSTTSSDENIRIVNMRNIDSVRYESDKRKVSIITKKDDSGKYAWLSVEALEAKPSKLAPTRVHGSHAGHGHGHGRPAVDKKPPRPRHRHPGSAAPPPPTKRPGSLRPAPGQRPGLKTPPPTAPTPAPGPKAIKPAKTDPPSLSQDPKADPHAKAPVKAIPKPIKPSARQPASQPTSKPAGQPAKPKVEKVWKKQAFAGNESADKLMQDFAQFSAIRALGQLGTEKLKEFGLTESKTELHISSGATTRTLIIGDKTYGNMDYYIQDKTDGRVYVIRPKPIQDLLYAEHRLMARSLHTITVSDIDQVSIRTPKQSKIIVQHDRRKPASAVWTNEGGDKTSQKESYKAWLAKIFRLRAIEYSKPEAAPENLNELFALEFGLGSRQKGYLKLYRQEPGPGAAAGAKSADSKGDFWAQSNVTRVPVKLSRSLADEIVRDLDGVLKD